MDKDLSIKIVDIQSREIDPFTRGNQSDSDEETYSRGEPTYMVQLFGIDEKRNTYSVFVEGFSPYFYVKVDATKGGFKVAMFEDWLKTKLRDKQAKALCLNTLKTPMHPLYISSKTIPKNFIF